MREVSLFCSSLAELASVRRSFAVRNAILCLSHWLLWSLFISNIKNIFSELTNSTDVHWTLNTDYFYQAPLWFSASPRRATCPILDLVIVLKYDKDFKSRSSTLRNFLQFPTNFSPLGPHIFLRDLFFITFTLCPLMWKAKFHPHKEKEEKIMVVFILILRL